MLHANFMVQGEPGRGQSYERGSSRDWYSTVVVALLCLPAPLCLLYCNFLGAEWDKGRLQDHHNVLGSPTCVLRFLDP